MTKAGDAARQAALALLSGVRLDGRMMADQLSDPAGPLEGLSPPDRARAQRLALDVFRNRARADRLIDLLTERRPPDPVRDILRLAVIELCVDGAAAHGVVDGAVALTKGKRKHAGASGMVNAVLRKIATEGPAQWDSLPVPKMPNPLRKPLVKAWGARAVTGIEAAHMAGAPLDLTVKENPAFWAEKLGAELLPTGSLRLRGSVQITALPGYEEGAWWIQDAAAALGAKLTGAAPGKTVADLCAAPGGKTLQLAAMGAQVTAVDLSEARLSRLHQNLNRTGLSAEVVAADALTWHPAELLDAVLVDAPCSATGTIRRHPDLPFLRSAPRIDSLVALQARMLDHAATLLKPGGRLVFCTCSLLPDEGEAQLAGLLYRNAGLRLADEPVQGLDDTHRAKGGGWRLRPDHWPELGGMDGFFIAAVDKS